MSALSAEMAAYAAPVGLHLLLGLVLGLGFFSGLRLSLSWALAGRPLLTATASLVRFMVLAGALYLVSREGAAPLLATAAGVVLARPLVLRGFREARR